MKLNLWNKWLLSAAICLLGSACQSLVDEDITMGEEGTLKVKTRSAAGEEISYPLSLYAFSEKGDCVASQTVGNAGESTRLSLPAGTYKIVSVSGYSEGYEIPAEPHWEDVIRLVGEAGAEVPLMIGKADVTVGADKESRLELVLSYAVTAVDFTFSRVPSEVAAVSVVLSPLYSSINMKGDYVDADYALSLDCSLNTGNLWSTRTKYVFPMNGAETTLSIVMKLKNGEVVTHGYVWKDAPKSGQPYHLHGEYSDGFALRGDFVVSGWKEAEEVEFTFGSVSPPTGEEEEDGDDAPVVDWSDLPEVGSIWNGTIVADVREAGTEGVDLLLLSLDEWSIQTSQVEELLSGYSVNGLADWRLPTYEEAKQLRINFSGSYRIELNEKIWEYDGELYGIDGEERYLCDKSGSYYSFIFSGGTSITQCGSKRSYYTRLVKTVRLSEKE